MSTIILPERPDTAEAIQLIDELEAYLSPLYPQESRHGYSVEKLIQQGVLFFVTRNDGMAAGCGGIQIFGKEYAEVKRMYVSPAFRGLGLAKQMLDHLAEQTHQQGVSMLRLETGIHQHEAIGLYERYGFQRRPPFGEYIDDPLSIYYEKRIG
jgi:ribosomal protein S18 acetylase RimI-like enzyme